MGQQVNIERYENIDVLLNFITNSKLSASEIRLLIYLFKRFELDEFVMSPKIQVALDILVSTLTVALFKLMDIVLLVKITENTKFSYIRVGERFRLDFGVRKEKI